MNCQDHPAVLQAVGLIVFPEQHGHRSGLPLVHMKDVWLLTRRLHKLQAGSTHAPHLSGTGQSVMLKVGELRDKHYKSLDRRIKTLQKIGRAGPLCPKLSSFVEEIKIKTSGCLCIGSLQKKTSARFKLRNE